MTIKVIFFDLWNTLFLEERLVQKKWHSIRVSSITKSLNKLGFNITYENVSRMYKKIQCIFREQQRVELVVTTPRQQLELLFGCLEIPSDQISTMHKDHLLELYISAAMNPLPTLDSNSEYILEYLIHKKKKIGLISNTGSTPGSIIRKILSEHNIKKYFSLFLFSDEVKFPKPHKSIFKRALSQASIDNPKNCVMIGDDYRTDIIEAKNIGMTTIWLNKNRKDIRSIINPQNIYHDYLIESLKEIDSIL